MAIQCLRDKCDRLRFLAGEGIIKLVEESLPRLVDRIRAHAAYNIAPAAQSAREEFYAMARENELVAAIPTFSIVPILGASYFYGVLAPVLVSAAAVGLTWGILVDCPKDLHDAIHRGSIETAKMLIRELPLKQLSLQDRLWGRTPLHLATMHGKTGIAQALIEKLEPEQLSLKDELDETPLHLAARHGETEIARALVGRLEPEQLSLKNAAGQTPLHAAVNHGRIQTVQALIDGLSPEQLSLQDNWGDTPLHIAVKHITLGFSLNFGLGLAMAEALVPQLPQSAFLKQSNELETPLELAERLVREAQFGGPILRNFSKIAALIRNAMERGSHGVAG